MVASVAVNGLLAATLVALNAWAVGQQLEETFVALALFSGLLAVSANAWLAASRR